MLEQYNISADAPPPPQQSFRQPRTKQEKIERWKNIARTFSPFFFADQNTTPAPQFNNYIWQQNAPAVTPEPFTFAPFSLATLATVAPIGPTLEPMLPTTASPQLLAHNTARMIREIATFSDGGKSRDQDFGAVQTLMQAFFEAVASGNNGGSAAATGTAVGTPLGDAPMYQARRDGTELGANRALTNKLFESDMVLTVPQMKAVVLAAQEARNPHGRKKRKVITGSVYRWKSVIPYRFKGGDSKWKKLIKEGLSLWEKETCVRWSENGHGKDYVIFFRGSGCYSSVGRTGGSQLISIGYGCEDKGIVAHEVGHSLGFWHEQSRPDRDQYIHLRKEWIIKGTDGNFEKRSWEEIEDMGVPYDIGSVMHYGSNAFTKDWDQITIETTDSRYQGTIGQRQKLSFIDVKQVNRLYCNSVCPVALSCQHGGYPDPNNCSVCKCPDGLGGKLCGRVAKGTDHDKCGGELVATPEWQEMIYKGKRTCNWRVKSPNGGRVRLVLTELRYQCATSCKAYIEIKHNTDFQQTGFRVCCFNKTYDVISDQSEALILSNANIVDYEVSYKLQWIQDNGKPLPPPKPTSTWVPGKENRPFRGVENTGGTIEKFILQAIPKIRDSHRPLESITSIVAEYGLATLLGISHNDTTSPVDIIITVSDQLLSFHFILSSSTSQVMILICFYLLSLLNLANSMSATVRPFTNSIPVPGRNVPIMRLFENYAASCRPTNKRDFNMDQLATLLQSFQMDEVATKQYNSIFFGMADMQIEKFMGKWYTVVDSKEVHKEDCSIFYFDMVLQTPYTATFTSKQYALVNNDVITNEGYGSMVGPEPGAVLITTGHERDQCPFFPVRIGGLNDDGEYQYMILSTPLKYPTMVLTRDLELFETKWKHEVYDFVEKNGFMSPMAALNTRLHFTDTDVCRKVNKLYENGNI
ncbi:hypothetical protein GCK72_001366 [Caenorhabditis remanei]|uniref:Metalloendopeptidase n=1 Tax=Caenorhabditis remanei TaxID=31234 RepID=A0A6A5HPE7_CAERE|nr:hypothetical protein GCK72_001366 [Caenorhabditis remanei]KAF1769549.1 hypothetical protein GCK72_001366 [Caenorhabditis remanei]